jgi:hypothetical protein
MARGGRARARTTAEARRRVRVLGRRVGASCHCGSCSGRAGSIVEGSEDAGE